MDQSHAPQVVSLVTCSCCENLRPESDCYLIRSDRDKKWFRCKCCNRINSRTQRLKHVCPDIVEGFQFADSQARVAFYNKAVSAFGPQLVKQMDESIQSTITRSSSYNFKATGRFLDATDLEEKYKDKPDQYKHIVDNADTVMCKNRNVLLYEDLEYQSETNTAESREERFERWLSVHRNSKQITGKSRKQLEGEKEGNNGECDEDNTGGDKGKGKGKRGADKDITEPQAKRIRNLLQKAGAAMLTLSETIVACEAPEIASELPGILVKRAKQTSDEYDAATTTLNAIAEAGKAKPSELKEAFTTMQSIIETSKTVSDKLLDLVETVSEELKASAGGA